MKVIELFAGIGAWSKALENLNIAHEVVAAIEFDKKTMDCYNSIHETAFVAQDITKVKPEDLPDCDMICYSPPCQSFSVAGKGLGTADPRGTLFWDALRIIQEKKPKYCLMENVKNLTGKAHRETFDSMLKTLEDAGYTNYWQVLNAKDYGIPQNRERVFVVSIRKDIERTFEFPQKFNNGLRLKDLLEESVDEKYYISDEKCQKLLSGLNGATTGTYSDGGLEPKVIVESKLITVGSLDRPGYHEMSNRVYSADGCTKTLCGGGGNAEDKTGLYKVGYRIRKLTPLECIRLMGFSDEDYEKLKEVNISNSQIYKVCGNSIVVNVVETIFKQLL